MKYEWIIKKTPEKKLIPERLNFSPLLFSLQLEELQIECMADDVPIDEPRMSLWTEAQARAFFESGGTEEPAEPNG